MSCAVLAHLVTNAAMSVNTIDEHGRSPLHIAAKANQPKAAQFLLRHSASVDARDMEGNTPLDIAVPLRWREMQRVLSDHATLFRNRSARATRLYKEGEYETACEAYEAARVHMEQMAAPPTAENSAIFYFNYGRASQSMGAMSHAIALFGKTLEATPKHERAVEHRADCHIALGDHSSASTDLRELTASHSLSVDASTRQRWSRRLAEVTAQMREEPHVTLGVERFASPADVKRAYRTACLQHHPDKHASGTDDAKARAKHVFSRIQGAYEKLTAQSGSQMFSHGSQPTYGRSASSYARSPTYGRPPGARGGAQQAAREAAQRSWWTGEGEFDGDDDFGDYD